MNVSLLENYLSVLLIFGVLIPLSLLERAKTSSWITPFTALAWPYAVVVLLINTVAVHFGFFPVNLKSIFLSSLGCLFFFLGGLIIHICRGSEKTRQDNVTRDESEFSASARTVWIILALLALILSLVNFLRAFRIVGGWLALASTEFEDAYGKGLLAHLMLINRPAFLFLSADYLLRKKRYTLVLLLLTLLSVLILQIKNHAITLILGAVFFCYFLGLLRINLKKIFLALAGIFLLFNLSYLIGFSRIGAAGISSGKLQLYLLNHFFTYIFGGPIGFSEILNNPAFPLYSHEPIFAVPLNIIHFISGNPLRVDTIIHQWVPVSSVYGFFHSSNVFTVFGMLYMYVGPYWMMIYLFLLGLISYLVRSIALKPGHIGFKMVYAFLLSFLAISFFGLYFNLLLIYEASILMLLITALERWSRSMKNFLTRRGDTSS